MSWSEQILAIRGPSLPRSAVPSTVEDLPPAAAGDLAALRHRNPCTIILIDGIFESRAAPWHKELLDLMARGFRVIGASSMGALRAAELAPFGMIGVGKVYTAFMSGQLVADDEVAILHAPVELDWRPVTDAMVDIRATLCVAVAQGVLSTGVAKAVRSSALALNFRDRTWARILQTAEMQATLSSALLRTFVDWLPTGHRSIKQEDALAALALAINLRAVPANCSPEPFRTSMLEELLAFADRRLQPKPMASASRNRSRCADLRNG